MVNDQANIIRDVIYCEYVLTEFGEYINLCYVEMRRTILRKRFGYRISICLVSLIIMVYIIFVDLEQRWYFSEIVKNIVLGVLCSLFAWVFVEIWNMSIDMI